MTKPKGSVEVIIRDLELNPKCRHGPTILFSRNGLKFFSCSSLRNTDCFYLDFDKFEQENLNEYSHQIKEEAPRNSLNYTDVLKLPLPQRIFCRTCGSFLTSTSSHESHDTVSGMSDEQLTQPSLLLPQLDDDKLNAQYFFDDNTLDFICSIFESLRLTKIICLGAPRLHDYIRSKKPEIQSILLDIDDRFQVFNRPDDFIRYNMFNNFFFDGSDEEKKFGNFLIDQDHSTRSQHVIFTDPPFAARTELLANNLRTISSQYKRVNSCHKVLPMMWIFPYFNEHHIKQEMPEMEMLDFQCSYMNHKAYRDDFKGRKAGSPVRIFTNVDPRIVKFPERFTKYKFCSKCKRSVSVNNNHCFVCKICPSKNGATYRHCLSCETCVKPNYVHCTSCGRCVQKTEHDCKTFQTHQECWLCAQYGHVEKTCNLMKKLKRKKDGSCMVCKGNKKHYLKKCPSKQKFLEKHNKLKS
jgi:Probable N6-adenine methyltransferase